MNQGFEKERKGMTAGMEDHYDDDDNPSSSSSYGRGRRRQQQQQQQRRRDDKDQNRNRDRNQWKISNMVRTLQIFCILRVGTWRQLQPLQHHQQQQRRKRTTIFVVPFVFVFVTYICVNSIQRNTISRLSKYQEQHQPTSSSFESNATTIPVASPQTAPTMANPSSSTVPPSLPPPAPSSSSPSSSVSSSLDCLLKWDRQKTMKYIDRWLEHHVPVLITAIRHRDVVYIIFTQEHIYKSKNIIDYNSGGVEWMCNYHNTNNDNGHDDDDDRRDDDNDKGKETTTTIQRTAKLAPLDRVHHNHVILICDTSIQQLNSSSNGEAAAATSITAYNWKLHSVYPTTKLRLMDDGHHNMTNDATATTTETKTTMKIKNDPMSSSSSKTIDDILYDLTVPLECDQLQEQKHQELRTPQTNRRNHQQRQPQESTTSQNENNHDEANNKNTVNNNRQLAACVRFKGNDDRQKIPEWIEYHRIIGIQHFWIFINDPWEVHNGTELTALYSNKSYVSLVPFNMNWNDYPNHITNKYQYNNRDPDWSQEPAQWQCLYMAKKFGYDWVVTTDVDEYIYISPTTKDTNNSVDDDASVRPPLQVYLDRFDTDRYASLIMASIPYGNNTFSNQSTTTSSPFYIIDYVWRRNRELKNYKLKRYKQFYNVRRTHSIGVHFLWMADNGLETNVQLDHSDRRSGVFLHHYKKPHAGVSGSGTDHMIKKSSMLVSDPTLRDEYRDQLGRVLEGLQQEIDVTR